jgi:hypothetical protein
MAEQTGEERRDALIDWILTVPPLSMWPAESLDRFHETCTFAMGLFRPDRRTS